MGNAIDRDLVLRLLNAGQRVSVIAERAGCSRETVYAIKRKREPQTATIKAYESHVRIDATDPVAAANAIKAGLERAGWTVEA